MPIRAACPGCHAAYDLADHLGGKRVVPAVPTTRNGRFPDFLSSFTWRVRSAGSRRGFASVVTRRRARLPSPAWCAIFAKESCASSDR